MKLSRLREDLEAEMEDLTASLFEEAHKMVRDANVKQGRRPNSIDTYFATESVLESVPSKVSAVADKNAGLVKIDRKSVEWHRGLIAIPVLEVNSRGVDGLENR